MGPSESDTLQLRNLASPRQLGSRRNRWAACASRQSFYTTDRVNRSSLSLPRKSGLVNSLIGLLGWLYYEAHFDCHYILMLGNLSPIKWRQRPDMTIAVDWGVINSNKQNLAFLYFFILLQNLSMFCGYSFEPPQRVPTLFVLGIPSNSNGFSIEKLKFICETIV